jgi:hypothetical protein
MRIEILKVKVCDPAILTGEPQRMFHSNTAVCNINSFIYLIIGHTLPFEKSR